MNYNCYNYPNIKLKAGDLVFFKPKAIFGNNFISAIVSSSPTEKAFYHVSIIARVDAASIELIEASPKNAVVNIEYKNLCKTHGFLSDIEVLRVDLPENKISEAIKIAHSLVGSAYNDIFASNFFNSKGEKSFYCSQLIQHTFNMAALMEVFPDIKMSFKDNTGEISPYWKLKSNSSIVL